MQPDVRTITLPRETVGMLLASAQGVYRYLLARSGDAPPGWRHVWALSEAIEATERAILEANDAE